MTCFRIATRSMPTGSVRDLLELAQSNGIKVVRIHCLGWGEPNTLPEEGHVNGIDHDDKSDRELVPMV